MTRTGDPKSQPAPLEEKHSRARRKLLKALAISGGAVATSKIVPERWAEPLAGLGSLPAHAQFSPEGSLSCEYTLDFIREATPFDEGVHNEPVGVFSEDHDIDVVRASVSPPVAGVTVNLDFKAVGASDVGFGPPGGSDQDAITNDGGLAVFEDVEYQPGTDAGADQAGVSGTFSAPGYLDCVVTVNFLPNT